MSYRLRTIFIFFSYLKRVLFTYYVDVYDLLVLVTDRLNISLDKFFVSAHFVRVSVSSVRSRFTNPLIMYKLTAKMDIRNIRVQV